LEVMMLINFTFKERETERYEGGQVVRSVCVYIINS
jgi:hypothetical protein